LPRSRFFWKLYASYVALVFLAVITVGVLVARRITRDTLDEVESSLRARAALLGELASASLAGQLDLGDRLRILGDSAGARLTIIAADGTVQGDSDEDPATMDNHGSRPEVVAARERGVGTATRFSRTVAAELMYVALAIRTNGQLVGYARAALPLTVVRERLARLRALVSIAGLLATAVALLVGLVIAERVTAPLRSMTEAATRIADGQYGNRVEGSAANDESGRLAQAFNRMAAELETRMTTITEDRTKLLTILGGMVEGIVAVDREQRVVHLNASGARMLRVSATASIGKPIWEVTRMRKVCDTVQMALHENREVTSELHLRRENREHILELHAAPLGNGQGTLAGAVLVLHEVTELRRLETVRQDFVANVSHELKTPITAIRGLIETVLDDEAMPEDTRARFLGKIREQSLRLSLLVTDLLTLARLESAEGVLQIEPVDLRELVGRAAGHFRPSADEHGIVLRTEVPSAGVRVAGDREALELVVNNLLDNALKYTPRGGQVWVRLRSESGMAVLAVEDTGIGIAREHHDRIFERFYRVDKARSRELGGTGLGLSIVKHVCKVLGGGIAVESALGRGSTFRVSLPLDSGKFTES